MSLLKNAQEFWTVPAAINNRTYLFKSYDRALMFWSDMIPLWLELKLVQPDNLPEIKHHAKYSQSKETWKHTAGVNMIEWENPALVRGAK